MSHSVSMAHAAARSARLRTARWLLAALAVAFGVAAAIPAADAQGRITSRHGDWQIRCERPVGAPEEQCALVQNVEAQDRANVSLTVIFLRTADRQARILRVLAPLGVLLPSGLGLSIDDAEVGLAGFVRCLVEGCIAEVQLDDGLIERFEAGTTATFVIFQTAEAGIGIPISLDGFAEGFAALDNPPSQVAETAPEPAPRTTVETETRTAAAPVAAEPQSFTIPPDSRSELDRLLEDDLFPLVAGALGAFLLGLIVLVAILIGRGRRRKRRERQVREEPSASAAPATAASTSGDDAEDEDLTTPRRPGERSGRTTPRLAAPQEDDQFLEGAGDEPRSTT